MKSALISVIIAAAVTGAVLWVEDVFDRDDALPPGVETSQPTVGRAQPAAVASAALEYTDELPEDVWVDGARTPGSDRRSLADAASSICFITKIEIGGVQGSEDTQSCVIAIDDFTGYWELIATVEEGGRSEVRCNARCLVWE